MKKKWKLLGIFLIVFGIIVFRVYSSLDYTFNWKHSPKNVELYEEDYMRIVNLGFQRWEKSNGEQLWMAVDYLRTNKKIDDPVLKEYSPITDKFEKILITDKENQSLKNICNNSFGSDCLSVIEVKKNQVEFWADSKWRALIYTQNGEKPIIELRDGWKAIFKKVNTHWFQMRLEYQH